jgi:formamidopyrimidine-DNA glycosylase
VAGRLPGFDLTEAGTRKKLAVHIVREVGDIERIATLGPEPLDPAFDRAAFASLLAVNKQLKGVLRDQSTLAGVGNAYSDEILHAARLSPFAIAGRLDDEQVDRLYTALREVLGAAVQAASGRPAGELKDAKRAGMAVHGRTGQACPVCADMVREVSFADSSLQYCATCQTGGKPLADRRMSRLLR